MKKMQDIFPKSVPGWIFLQHTDTKIHSDYSAANRDIIPGGVTDSMQGQRT